MDEYVSDVAEFDITTNSRPHFKWPDLISVYFSDKLYALFESNKKFISKISKPNIKNLYATVFARDPDVAELTIKNYYSFYEFKVQFLELHFTHERMKFYVNNSYVLIDNSEYSKVSDSISFKRSYTSGFNMNENGRYYDTLTISRELIENYVFGTPQIIRPAISGY